jgi:cholesterol transport system auxiliary component
MSTSSPQTLPRHVPSLRLACLALAAALLGGCALGGEKTTPTVYAPELRLQADPAWPSVGWQLTTSRPTAARVLDSVRMAVSPVPGELQVYKGALWARTPNEMLEDAVLRILEDSGKLPAVARQGSGIRADYRLVMDIRHFEATYHDPSSMAAPAAVVEVNAKLLHAQDQAVVDSRSFRHVRPADGTAVPQVSQAFGEALEATSRDIAGWLLQAGHAHERSHRN